MTATSTAPRRFLLLRHTDPAGVSGTGVVAQGVRFGDGSVALHWTCSWPATAVWTSIDDLLSVHGHESQTVIRWLDAITRLEALDQ